MYLSTIEVDKNTMSIIGKITYGITLFLQQLIAYSKLNISTIISEILPDAKTVPIKAISISLIIKKSFLLLKYL